MIVHTISRDKNSKKFYKVIWCDVPNKYIGSKEYIPHTFKYIPITTGCTLHMCIYYIHAWLRLTPYIRRAYIQNLFCSTKKIRTCFD